MKSDLNRRDFLKELGVTAVVLPLPVRKKISLPLKLVCL